MCVHFCVCIYIYIYIFVCVCVCIEVHINIYIHFTLRVRICQQYSLKTGKTSSKRGCPGYDIELHLMVIILFWRSREYEVYFHCH